MDDIFNFRDQLIDVHKQFSQGFCQIRAKDINALVEDVYHDQSRYWPEPLIQLSVNYEKGTALETLVRDGTLSPDCIRIFQFDGQPLSLYRHQEQAALCAHYKKNYVVTTGTGSGKSLTFFIPIVSAIIEAKQRVPHAAPRVRAVIIYPMNALANSQEKEIKKFLSNWSDCPISVGRYTGQESSEEKKKLADNPPDILLTNYMMLEWMLTRRKKDNDAKMLDACQDLQFLVLDELHTYRGRQGADVAMLLRRLRATTQSQSMLCVGTSATMSSSDDIAERVNAVKNVAALLFGVSAASIEVIEEKLERITDLGVQKAQLPDLLRSYLVSSPHGELSSLDELKKHPLAIWCELNLGVTIQSGHMRRAAPKSLSELAKLMQRDLGDEFCQCHQLGDDLLKNLLKDFLMQAHKVKLNGRSPFAFKLHQLISGPGRVMLTLEPEGQRDITLEAQSFSSDSRPLYTAYFCRNCGHEFLPVFFDESKKKFTPRPIDVITNTEDDEVTSLGFLTPCLEDRVYRGEKKTDGLPDSWLEERKGELRIKSAYKKKIPKDHHIDTYGNVVGFKSPLYFFSSGRFRFCPQCGHYHERRERDYNRLATLSGESRSSATTVITQSSLLSLFSELHSCANSAERERMKNYCKLLGFTDNRQDAALQAGHFNDFHRLALIRSAIYKAVREDSSEMGLGIGQLVDKVFYYLGFGSDAAHMKEHYLKNKNLEPNALLNTQKYLRFYIGYQLYRDLREAWRYNCPSLEKLNLLAIKFDGLDALAKDHVLEKQSSLYSKLDEEARKDVLHELFNSMRHKMCIHADELNLSMQETLRPYAAQIRDGWVIESHHAVSSSVLVFDQKYKSKNNKLEILLSPRSAIVQRVSRIVSSSLHATNSQDVFDLVYRILQRACDFGITQKLPDREAYQLLSACLRWKDARREKKSKKELHYNPFFKKLFETLGEQFRGGDHYLFDLIAAEHTAQVSHQERENLERRFRAEKSQTEESLLPLPLMFCSPTMELGVDISSLNFVYMRNVPPTAANYAQRSGRAGRSGEPAIALTYCHALSPHDLWFFKNPAQMVSGVVKPPVLDLRNRDLIDSHLRATFLGATRKPLPGAISDVLKLPESTSMRQEEEQLCPIAEDFQDLFKDASIRQRAENEVSQLFEFHAGVTKEEWEECLGDSIPDYCHKIFDNCSADFDRAFELWRELYRTTEAQMKETNDLLCSPAFLRESDERRSVEARNRQAKEHFAQLVAPPSQHSHQSGGGDLYTYRYLASQGFIPGYNFPRLPLIAWMEQEQHEVGGGNATSRILSRPRFLALQEFGPNSLIYHRGRIYKVDSLKISPQKGQISAALPTQQLQLCEDCAHCCVQDSGSLSHNICENCQSTRLASTINGLYQIESVVTKRSEFISAQDEERRRQGFEVQTYYRFAEIRGCLQSQHGTVLSQEGEELLTLSYGSSATIWKINKGLRRRAAKEILGFNIDPMSGRWCSEPKEGKDASTKTQRPVQRIIPYVKDVRNILILNIPAIYLQSDNFMPTAQAAFCVGISRHFEVEPSEIGVDSLYKQQDGGGLLIYEASEGGAGVLRSLLDDPKRLALVARDMLIAMHINPDTGEDESNTDCHQACYRCLLQYSNQIDHESIDRTQPLLRSWLMQLQHAEMILSENSQPSPVEDSAESVLSRWQKALLDADLQEPSEYNKEISYLNISIDALYANLNLCIFIGELPDAAAALEQMGQRCLCFAEDGSDWDTQFQILKDYLS